MVFFAKVVDGSQSWTTFAKNYTLDVWQASQGFAIILQTKTRSKTTLERQNIELNLFKIDVILFS